MDIKRASFLKEYLSAEGKVALKSVANGSYLACTLPSLCFFNYSAEIYAHRSMIIGMRIWKVKTTGPLGTEERTNWIIPRNSRTTKQTNRYHMFIVRKIPPPLAGIKPLNPPPPLFLFVCLFFGLDQNAPAAILDPQFLRD